jgi:hypothetical protein
MNRGLQPLALLLGATASAVPALGQARPGVPVAGADAADDWRSRPPVECTPPAQAPDHRSVWAANLWPGGVVPYAFDANTSSGQRVAMRAAMDELERVAAVRFVARTSHADWVQIRASTGNGSWVGRQGGSQVINIYNWNMHYVMCHELMHALGVWHEHARPDRAEWVVVNYANIQPAYAHNFNIAPGGVPEGPYDFDSVMHYAPCSFSVCCPAGSVCACETPCASIQALPAYADRQGAMGQRSFLSAGDRAGLVSRYGPPPAAGVLNIDASTRCAGGEFEATVVLPPGSYAVLPVAAGGPEGGVYDAWMSGAGPAGCGAACCDEGWVWSYQWRIDSGEWTDAGEVDCARATAAGARAAHARAAVLALPAGGSVAFRINDAGCGDNSGGVSLRIAACVTLTAAPQGVSVVAGSPVILSVATAGETSPAFQWRRDGQAVTDGDGVQGATSSVLTIPAAARAHAGAYDVVVTDACGTVTSDAAAVTVYCSADWNRDHAITPADVGAFVSDWSASVEGGTAGGDFDGNGSVNPADVGTFVVAWFAQAAGSC